MKTKKSIQVVSKTKDFWFESSELFEIAIFSAALIFSDFLLRQNSLFLNVLGGLGFFGILIDFTYFIYSFVCKRMPWK